MGWRKRCCFKQLTIVVVRSKGEEEIEVREVEIILEVC